MEHLYQFYHVFLSSTKYRFRTGIILIFLLVFSINNTYSQNCSVTITRLSETICEGTSYNLDGEPVTPIIGTVQWTQTGGPSVVIDNPNTPTPQVLGLVGGNIYTFRYSAICGDGVEASQSKTLTVDPITQAQISSGNVASCPDNSGSITVSANSASNPGENGLWTIEGGSNPAGAVINFPTSPTTTITLPSNRAGTSTLRWTIENSGNSCSSFDEITITNFGGVEPVDAGPNQVLSECYTISQSTRFNATFGGGNAGNSGQIGTWIFVSGPNNPTISNPNNNRTRVSNLREGTYTFRWSVSGPCANGSDTMTIEVPAATQDVTQASVEDNNIFFCDSSVDQTTLVGSTPVFANEVVLWEQIGGDPVTITPDDSYTTQITGLSPAGAPYRFRYTIRNTATNCTSSFNQVTINYNTNPITITVNGGSDLVATCDETNIDIPYSTTGGGSDQYRIVSGPADAPFSYPTSFTDVNGGNLNIDLENEGTYTFVFRRRQTGQNLASCQEATDQINVTITRNADPPANVGTDQNLNCNEVSTELTGNTQLYGETLWSQVSGPNTATISDPSIPRPTVTNLVPGVYTFRYTINNAPVCPFDPDDNVSFDDVVVNVASATNISAAAGPDQTICTGTNVQLAANTPPSDQTGTWSGPSGITFSDDNDPSAIASGFGANNTTYTLTWTIENINVNCDTPTTDTVDIITNNDNAPTQASAGDDQCITDTSVTSTNLDANTPITGEQGAWSQVSGPSTATFATISDPQTPVSNLVPGTYEFRWTISFDPPGACPSTTDTVIVTIANVATADAGPDPVGIQCTTSYTAAANDPSPGGQGTWSLIAGNANFTIDDINRPDATFSNLTSGTYEFQWTVSAAACPEVSDTFVIQVGTPAAAAVVRPTPDVCSGNSATLDADAVAQPSTGVWTLDSGAPNAPTIVDPNDPNTNVTGLITGEYTFRWTVSGSGTCPSNTATTTFNVFSEANAGPDQQLCEATSILLEATRGSLGTWSVVSTGGAPNPQSTYDPVQSPPNSSTASATVEPGFTYVYRFTTDYGASCPSTQDEVTVVVSSGPSVSPNAGDDQILCNGDTTTTTLNGSNPPSDPGLTATWSFLEQPPGSVASITNPNQRNTDVTGLSQQGLYILQWNFAVDNCGEEADIMRIEVFAAPTPVEAGPDQPNACQEDIQLNATTPTEGVGTWSFANAVDDPSGGAVIIDGPNNPQTTLSNVPDDANNDGNPDVYVLTWTVSNGQTFPNPSSACNPQSDTVTITFTGAPPSQANAGPDQELCDDTQTNLNAVPLSSGTGTWTQTSGPSGPTIASPNNPSSLVIDLSPGTFEFTWTAVGGGCSSADTMEITVQSDPITAEAGPNQTIREFTTLTLGATPATAPAEGRWTQISGPTTANFIDETDPTTQVTGVVAGIYVFEWTITNGICNPRRDQVTIEITPTIDIELDKSVPATPVKPGETVIFTIAIFNNDAANSADATGVEVVDVIPAGYSLVPGTVSNSGLYNAGNLSITWSNLTVTNGATLNLTFNAVVNASGPYENTAQITASNEFDEDATPNNDDPTEDDQDSAAVTIAPNDPPVAQNDEDLNNTLGDNVTVNIINNDNDPDGNLDEERVNLVPPAGFTILNEIRNLDNDLIGFTVENQGSWSYDDDTGSVTFSPEPGFTGNPAPISYTIRDNEDAISNSASITVTYTLEDPVANDDANLNATVVNANTVLNIINNDVLADGNTPTPNDVDVDLDLGTAGIQNTLTVTGQGEWTYDPANGEVTFDPDVAFTTNPDVIPYQLIDLDNNRRSNTANITIIYQEPPVAVNDLSEGNNPGSTVNVPITANDFDPDGPLDPGRVNLIPPTGPTISGTVTNSDGDVIGFTVENEGTWLYDEATRQLSFDPQDGFTGNPTVISYTIRDTEGNESNIATVGITYDADPPVANDDELLNNAFNSTVTLNIINNDELADGTTPTPTDVNVDLDPNVVGIQNSLTVADQGTWTYTPANGTIEFVPNTTDLVGDPDPIPYTLIDLDNNEQATAQITVTYQEQDPIANNDSSTGNQPGGIVSLPITANDTDPDGTVDPTTVDLIPPTGPTITNIVRNLSNDIVGFTVVGEGVWSYNEVTGLLSFDPDEGFTGDPTDITYNVDDDDGNMSVAPATVSITYDLNPEPIANDDERLNNTPDSSVILNIIENDQLADGSTPTSSDVDIDLDLDPGSPGVQNTLTVTNQGVWTYNSNGTITFVPDAALIGDPDPINYALIDLDNNEQAVAQITITYQNQAPIANNDLITGLTTGTATTFNPFVDNGSGIDEDLDGTIDVTTVQLVGTTNPGDDLVAPNEGVWSVNTTTGEITFTPCSAAGVPDASCTQAFTGDPTPIQYTVADNDGARSNQATITLDYDSQPPVAQNDLSSNNVPGTTVTLDPTADNGSGIDSDPDGSLDVTSISLVLPPGATNVVTDSDGEVTSFTIPGEGSWSVNLTTGAISFTPNPNYTLDPTPVNYTIKDNDGNISNEATVTIDYAPITSDDLSTGNTTNTAVTVDVLANDTTGDTVDVTTVQIVGTASPGDDLVAPNQGVWSVNTATGEITFTPCSTAGVPDASCTGVFTGNPSPIDYTVADDEGNRSNESSVTITYDAQPPIANDDLITGLTTGAVTTFNPFIDNGSGIDSDPDGTLDPTSVQLVGTANPGDDLVAPNEGVWSVNTTTGEITFTPCTAAGVPDASCTQAFTGDPTPIQYTVADNDGNISNQATITLDYDSQPPVAQNDLSSNNVPGTTTTLDPTANNGSGIDSDPDGSLDVTSISLVPPPGATNVVTDSDGEVTSFTIPGEGSWSANLTTGAISFTPNPSYTLDPTPVNYTIKDNDGNISNEAIVTIDYVPIASADLSTGNTPTTAVTVDVLANDTTGDTVDVTTVQIVGTASPGDDLVAPNQGVWSVNTTTGEITFTPCSAAGVPDASCTGAFVTNPAPIQYTVEDDENNRSNPAEVTVEYNDVADLSLTKRVVDNDVTPFTGTEITFEIRVTNDGPGTATGVVVTDLLPNGYDFILYSSTAGVYNEVSGEWTIGNISSGDTESLLIDVLVNETGNYTNVAEVTAANILDPDSTPNNNILAEDDQDEVVVTPVLTPRIDLSVTKMADDMNPDVGGQIEFTMTVTNGGPSDATNVVVTDLLASGYEYNGSTVTVGTYQPLNGSWTVGTIANGDTETLIITANVLESGDYTNVVEVTGATEMDINSTPANNDDEEDDQVTIEPVPVPVSDLSVTKSVNNTTPRVGSTVQFTILLENGGLSDDRDIEVTDILPNGYTFVSYEATAGVYNEVSGLWTVNRTLSDGDIERLTISATVNPTGNYTNTAEITASDNLASDPDLLNNTSSIGTTPVAISDLSLTKTVNNANPDVTDTIIFTLELSNDGPSDATGVAVTDVIPSGFNWISDTSGGDYNSGTGIWTVGTLGSGLTTSIDITVSINTVGSYINVAEVTAVNELDPDSVPGNGNPSEDDQDEVQVFPRVITDISVTKAVDVSNPPAGSQIAFTVTITNDGPSDATGIVVEDILASGYQFDSATPTVGIYDETIGSWNIGNLANGLTETLTIVVTVLPTGNYSNTAELIALNTFDPDSNPDNNIDSEDDQATVNPVPSGLADLSIEKIVSNATPLVGDTVEFTINVTNSGDSDATGVQIRDQLPVGYTFVSYVATAGLYDSDTGIWSINGTILDGTTESLILLTTVNDPTDTEGEYINSAEIIASDQADPDSNTNSDSTIDDLADGIADDDEAQIVVSPQFVDISIDKVVSPVSATIGEEVTFTITATNNSTAINATNVLIEDVLPAGYRFVSSDNTSGTYNEVSGLWSIPSIDINTTETLAIIAEVLDIDDYVNIASLFDLDQYDTNTSNDSGEAFIETQCLTIFNEFSPNNDGTNDTFNIDCISRYPNNRLEIYNRWGNIVYEKDGYDNTWDGTSNGRAVIYVEEKLPVGTYYYVLSLGDGSEPKAGWVYLNR